MEEKRKNIRETLHDFNLTLLDFKRNVNHDHLYYFHGFHMIVVEGIEHLLKLIYSTSKQKDNHLELNVGQRNLEDCFEELCKILLNFFHATPYDDDHDDNDDVDMDEKRKNMTRTLKDLNITLLDFKRNIDKFSLHYYHGFHMIVKEGIEHLLQLLYQTSKTLEIINGNHEVNRAQVDVEDCFEELCKILLNFVNE